MPLHLKAWFVSLATLLSQHPSHKYALIVRFALLLLMLSGVILVYSGRVYAQSPVTYYVNCRDGNDKKDGRTPAAAWQSIKRANRADLQPGDKLLLLRDCTWQGPLKAKWQGSAAQPITIGAYGPGALPIIQNSASTNVEITGSYQVIEYLETTLTTPPNPDPGCQNQPVAWRVGFEFSDGAAYNTLQYVKAHRLAIGVYLRADSYNNKVLYNTIVDNNVVWSLTATGSQGATGVALQGNYQEIAYNYFANNRTICTYNDIVESNSIELYNASNANIHHNRSIGDRVFSELGTSSNSRTADNIFAYNVHVVGPMQSALGARFVVTRGDGHQFGPVWRTQLLYNTVYHTGEASKGVTCQQCSPEVLTVKNNIFWVEFEPITADGPFVEEDNIFWASDGKPFIKFAKSGSSQIANPRFVDAADNNFYLQATSPAQGAGAFGLAPTVAPIVAPDVAVVPAPDPAPVAPPANPPSASPARPAPAPASGIVQSLANIRSGPALTYAIVGSADSGQTVTILGCNEGCTWYQVAEAQWIAAFLVGSDVATPEVTGPATGPDTSPVMDLPVTALAPPSLGQVVRATVIRSANLRGGPGVTYPVVGSATPGQVLEVVGRTETGDWVQLASGFWIAAFLVTT